MNAGRLLAHYERIADAPEAVIRLRRLILDLAVRGKLVDQDPSDKPVADLLQRIADEKARLGKAGSVKEQTSLLCDGASALDSPIPTTWTTVRLVEVSNIVMGQSPPGPTYNTDGDGVPLINGPLEFTDGPFGNTVVNQYTTAPTNTCNKGDFLICIRGSTTGRTNIAAFDACIGRGVAAIQPLFEDSFVRHFLWSMRERIIAMGRGIAFPSITRKQLENLSVPLPPLAEQHRIVAKVDKLMTLCDRVEAMRADRETTRNRLTAASLTRLNAPDTDTATFKNHATFALENLTPFTTRPDQIKVLRQTILNLGVRGKLVKQDAEDEPVEEILKKIRIERNDLVQRKQIRREKPLDQIDDSKFPFSVPHTWCWTRIGEVALFTQYGTSTKSAPAEQGIPVLTMGNIQDGRIVFGNEKKIPGESQELPMLFLRKFDLLYNRTNSAELVGKTGIYLGDDNRRTFASYLIRIRLSHRFSSPRYVNLAMNAPVFRETQIVPLIKKQTGQANVNGTALKHMLLPLPPLTEQRRIVAKVDELMALCDRLEESLATSNATRRRLLDAVLHDALALAADRKVSTQELRA
ncbi:MAG: restriction endonuclease subunit S [Gammaproteobacteria bacterium]|nr:restriction endonuclease subunit S [Gammaproteobacteria bacterium]